MHVQTSTDEQAKTLFSGLTRLESLSIAQCCVEIDRNVQHLQTLSTLTNLKWHVCKTEFDIRGPLRCMRSLRTLKVREGHSPAVFAVISRYLVHLTELGTVALGLSSSAGVSTLASMKRLRSLEVSTNEVCSLVDALSSPGRFPSLESLFVGHKHTCTEEQLEELEIACQKREDPILDLKLKTDKALSSLFG